MNLSELEDKIYKLESAVDSLKEDLNAQSLFILRILSNPNYNMEDCIDPNYFSSWLKKYIIDHYQDFNHKILSKLLESPNYLIPNDWCSEKIFNDYEYILMTLKNPNLSEWQKKELKNRKRNHEKKVKKSPETP